MGSRELAAHLQVAIFQSLHFQSGQPCRLQLSIHLLGQEGCCQGMGKVAPENRGAFCGVTLNHQGPGAGPLHHGLPLHGWIVEVMQKVVAHDHAVGRSEGER